MTEAVPDPDASPSRRRAVTSFLAGDRTPMWVTLLVLLAGATGTYYLAPQVNAQFEAQKLRTDFVLQNYNDLRLKMEDFQGLYSTVALKLVTGEPVQAEVFRLQELVARVGAQNVALLPIFTAEAGPKAASEVNAAMNGMINVIFAHAGTVIETDDEVAAYQAEVMAATNALVVPLLELYVRIGEVGRLNPTEKDVELTPGS